MELMDQMTSEQHVAKELANRLSQQEDELTEIRDQVCLVHKLPTTDVKLLISSLKM